MNYAIYVGIHAEKKVLFLVFDEGKPTDIKNVDDLAALYNDDKLIGVNIFDENLADSLSLGLQVAPKKELLDAINAHLAKLGIPALEPVASGYEVVEVTLIEEHPLNEKLSIVTLKTGEGELGTVTRYSNFKVGDHLVAAKDGAHLFDGTVFHKRVERNIPIDMSLCSEADLHIGEDFKNAVIVDLPVGADYFAK